MNTPPALPTVTDLPTADSQASSSAVRAVGWALVVIGPCLSLAMAAVVGSLADTIYHVGRPAGPTRWHGGPEFTRVAFELFGVVFLLGIGIFTGGVYQVRTGRRHPVLVGIVLVLAAVMAYLVCTVILAPPTSVQG